MSKTTNTIEGLRYQNYPDTKEVHIHDDQRSMKFIGDNKEFKNDLSEAMKDFDKGPGAAVIEGSNGIKLCLVKDDKKLSAFLTDSKDLTKELKSFLKTL